MRRTGLLFKLTALIALASLQLLFQTKPSIANTAIGCEWPECTGGLPSDSGALNVRDYGAKGDGVTDDTAAINAALAASGGDTGTLFWQNRMVYLPNGTYLVSGPLAKHYANGEFGSGLMLFGESRAHTIIRLADHEPGYADPSRPLAVVYTSSKLLDKSQPTGGGKDYHGKGEGNDAYANFVENLTIDTGMGNPGAVGIDYLANNLGAVRNVSILSGDDAGTTGILMTRKWPGPALLEGVTIKGFGIGIDIDNTEYGMTLDNIAILSAGKIGIRNNHNMISARRVHIDRAPLAIANISPDGMMVIDGGESA
jgi:hypothetical protein